MGEDFEYLSKSNIGKGEKKKEVEEKGKRNEGIEKESNKGRDEGEEESRGVSGGTGIPEGLLAPLTRLEVGKQRVGIIYHLRPGTT